MSKHTLEKWTVQDDGFGCRIEPSIAWIGYGSAHPKAEHKANARLIAAAPTLLEMLKKAVARQGFSNEELIDARAEIKRIEGGE